MKRAFKNIGLICTVVFLIPLISALPLQFNQKQSQKSNTKIAQLSLKNGEEIFKPSNWIACAALLASTDRTAVASRLNCFFIRGTPLNYCCNILKIVQKRCLASKHCQNGTDLWCSRAIDLKFKWKHNKHFIRTNFR